VKASQEKDNHLYCLTRCAQNSRTLSPCNSDVVAVAVTGAAVAVAAVGGVTFIANVLAAMAMALDLDTVDQLHHYHHLPNSPTTCPSVSRSIVDILFVSV